MSLHRQVMIAGLALSCAVPHAATGHAAADQFDYRIQPGDTFIGVTQALLRPGTPWQSLQRANPRLEPLKLPPGGTLHIPNRLLRETAELAEVLYVNGAVTVERPGAAPGPLAGGEKLQRGDRLRTGVQSSAALRFADGARVLLRPSSALVVDNMVRLGQGPSASVRTELNLPAGSADSQVPSLLGHSSQFRIRTPVANLGVRGTEFRTTADEHRTQVEVLDGTVAVRGARSPERPVAAGFGTMATPLATDPPQPLLPAPDLSQAPRRIERLPLTLGWSALPGAAQYRAQIFMAGPTAQLQLDGLFNRPLARWPDDLPDGDYELRARAVAPGGIEGRDARWAFTLKARPEPPLLISPAADARVGTASVDLAWARNPAAVRYHLQVASDENFQTLTVDRDDVTANGASIELPVGTHHWRLASIRAGDDQGPWGDSQRITRVELPPPPATEPPQNEAGGIRLRWAQGAPGTSYQIQVARNDRFEPLIHDEQVQQPDWLLPKPEPGSYWIRVRAIDSEGFKGPFGAAQAVEVPANNWWLILLPLLVLVK